MSSEVHRAPLKINNSGGSGFLPLKENLDSLEIKLVTDNKQTLNAMIPKKDEKRSLESLIKDYSVIEYFQDYNIAFYQGELFDEEVQLTIMEPLCIPGEEWVGTILFSGNRYQPLHWRAHLSWTNEIFRRGDEVEHSERIYAEPKSITGWEIKVGQPFQKGEQNDWILRRRLASLIESTIAALETNKKVSFPVQRNINNLIVRRPHQVNLPYVVGLGEEIY